MDRAERILVYKVLKNLVPELRKDHSDKGGATLQTRRLFQRVAFSQRLFNTLNVITVDVFAAPSACVFKCWLDLCQPRSTLDCV